MTYPRGSRTMRTGTTPLVIVGYSLCAAFLVGGLAWIGYQMQAQYAVSRDMKIVRMGGAAEEVRAAQERLAQMNALVYTISYLDSPPYEDKRMRVYGTFQRLITGYPDRVSKRQKRAVKTMMAGRIMMPPGLDLSGLYPKFKEFVKGEHVYFTEQDMDVMARASEAIAADYENTLLRAVGALDTAVKWRLKTGKDVAPVETGDISRLLGNDSEKVRSAIGNVLLEIGPGSYKWLKKLLEHSVQKVLAQATDEYTEEERYAQLIDEDHLAKREAILILLRFNTPEARDIIEWAREEPRIKAFVEEVLASVGHTSKAG